MYQTPLHTRLYGNRKTPQIKAINTFEKIIPS